MLHLASALCYGMRVADALHPLPEPPYGCALTGVKRRLKKQALMRSHGGTGARAKKTGWPMQQRPGYWVWLAGQVVVLVMAVSRIHQIGISDVISLSATAGKACRYLQKERKD